MLTLYVTTNKHDMNGETRVIRQRFGFMRFVDVLECAGETGGEVSQRELLREELASYLPSDQPLWWHLVCQARCEAESLQG